MFLTNFITLFGQLTGADCNKGSFFGLIPWYQYLSFKSDCTLNIDLTDSSKWNQIWLVGIATIDDLLRIVGLVAFFLIIYGGFRYITSQGAPEQTKKAQSTILNALIGVVVAVLAITGVSFFADRLERTNNTVGGLPTATADNSLIANIFNIFLAVVGAVAVLMIVISALKFATSRGNEQSIAKARATILYAVVGLAIIVLAWTILNFVLTSIK